jgi:mannose-6-phosphate isomerase-like protein (cupin superfamily)
MAPPKPHFTVANHGIHHEYEVKKSQEEFGWKVVDMEDPSDPWVKWDCFNLDVTFDHMDIDWKDLADMEFSWTGVCKMKPGAYLPMHIHAPPEFYYILKGNPMVVLNGIYNRCRPIQCVTIPPNCPHKIYNDTTEEIVFIYTYLPCNEVVTKADLKWVFLEETTPADPADPTKEWCHKSYVKKIHSQCGIGQEPQKERNGHDGLKERNGHDGLKENGLKNGLKKKDSISCICGGETFE